MARWDEYFPLSETIRLDFVYKALDKISSAAASASAREEHPL